MPALLSRRDEARALRLARSQPESLAELNELAERLRTRVGGIALGDGRVRDRLAGVRHRVVAVDYRDEKDDTGRAVRLGDVAIYDYSRDLLVVASIDSRSGLVVNVVEREGVQPPITDDERDDAIRLVRHDTEVGRALRRKRPHVVAFPTPSYAFDAEPARRGHRGCTVYVRVGRGRVLAATIDLSSEEVVPDDRLPEGLRSPASRGARAQRVTSASAASRATRRARRGSGRSTQAGA